MDKKIRTALHSNPIEEMPKHLVMIMGMHRSGTSAAGRLLKHLGFYFGDNLIQKMDKVNADGFWEDRAIVAINERIFQLLNSSWYSFQPLPAEWWLSPAIDECYVAAAHWLDENHHHQMPAAIKDPRFCRLLPFWLYFFKQKNIEPKIIFIYRHPYSVAASLKKRDGFDFEVSSLLWLSYTLDALEKINAAVLSIVCYEKLIDKPIEVTKSLLNNGFAGVPSLKRLRYARVANSTILPEKNHNPFNSNLQGDVIGIYRSLACELYGELDTATAENCAAIAIRYRKRLNVLAENTNNLLAVLQENINHYVDARQQLSAIGMEHSLALATLSKKDALYERAMLDVEKRISGSKAYIKKCESRIREQDELLKPLGKKAELVENLQRAVIDRENKLSENAAYIKKCESRIKEQDKIIFALKELSRLWSILRKVKQTLGRLVAK